MLSRIKENRGEVATELYEQVSFYNDEQLFKEPLMQYICALKDLTFVRPTKIMFQIRRKAKNIFIIIDDQLCLKRKS